MSQTDSATNTATAQRLQTLVQLYEQGQASKLAERTLDKLLAYELDVTRDQLRQLSSDLAAFERQYGTPSEEFYRRFQAGETDDRMDYVEWASLVQMAGNLKKRLELLTGQAVS